MTIAPGTHIGPYEITAKLGEGGMGVVWKAKDFHLGREVALKVLPEGFTEDPERLQRFEREAKVLASLNHPNVAQIYGLEASGDTRALIMELVEGPTLAERLEQGSLPLDESLSIARQIAEALEEAHEKGIVHRDLKPQNVKASIEGKVKVLDFGLAKAMDPAGTASGAPSASRLAASPTLTLGATVQGVILGTAAYMAPEQARGTGVDARADIWAFGVVLYEMLSGRTAFTAETVPDTLAAVLTREIDWSALPESTPPAIRRLLRRCLERKPKSRLHSIADARIVIDEVLAGVAEPAPIAVPAPAAAVPPRSRWLLPAVAVAAIAVGFAAGRFAGGPATSAAESELEVALALPADYSLSTRDLVELAISPDGRRQVVTVFDGEGRSHLLLRDLDQAEARVLPGTEGARAPFFSPAGDSVAFFVNSDLRRIAVSGGPSLRIAEVATAVATRGGTWGRDGFIYFVPNTAIGLKRVRENGGVVEAVTETAAERNERTHRWPAVLPDASAVLFTNDSAATTEYYDDANIEAVRLATGERKVLVEGSSQARFLPPDRLVFARQGALFAVAFDPRRLEIAGTPIVVAQNIDTDVSSGAAQFAISESGDLTWIPGEASGGIMELAWLRLDGSQQLVDLRRGNYVQLALSPDGGRVALADAAPPNVHLWIGDLTRRSLSRLTFEGSSADPVWSPDGRRVAFSNVPSTAAAPEIVWKPADGSGASETLSADSHDAFPSSFSPDGKWLVVERRFQVVPNDQADIWLLPVGGAGAPRAFLVSPHEEFHSEVSPDGRWLAYTSLESGVLEVYLRPFPAGEGKWLVSTSGGAEPHWSADSKAIYYRNPNGIYRIAVQLAKGVELGEPRLVGPTLARGTLGRTFSVAADGSVLVLRRPQESQLAQQVNLALGWRSRVERLVSPRR